MKKKYVVLCTDHHMGTEAGSRKHKNFGNVEDAGNSSLSQYDWHVLWGWTTLTSGSSQNQGNSEVGESSNLGE